MTDILLIASAVAADSNLSSWHPVINFAPEYSLSDISDKTCCVAPMDVQFETQTRGRIDVTYKIDVCFMIRTRNSPNSIISEIQSIAKSMMNKKYSNAVCTNVSFAPMVASEQLRGRNQLTSVLSLTLTEVG